MRVCVRKSETIIRCDACQCVRGETHTDGLPMRLKVCACHSSAKARFVGHKAEMLWHTPTPFFFLLLPLMRRRHESPMLWLVKGTAGGGVRGSGVGRADGAAQTLIRVEVRASL